MKANEAPEKIYIPRLITDGKLIHEWNDVPFKKFRFFFDKEIAENIEYIRADVAKVLIEAEGDNGYGKGCEYTRERIKEALLSEVLPCFMHGGEADEVVAKLDEVLNQKK